MNLQTDRFQPGECNFRDLNLNELVYLARQSDEEALHLLYQAVRNLAMEVRLRCCHTVISSVEWETEMMLVLDKAIYFFNERRKTSFATLFYRMAEHRAFELLRSHGLYKNRPFDEESLGSVQPLEVEREDRTASLQDFGMVEGESDFSGTLLCRIACEELLSLLRPYLKPRQLQILALYGEGYSKQWIASHLSVHRRTVEHAFRTAAWIYSQIEPLHAAGRYAPASFKPVALPRSRASQNLQGAWK